MPQFHEDYVQSFYKSWGNEDYDTGLATLSKLPLISSEILVSPIKEPIAGTPKISSVEVFDLEGRTDKLMVINTHGINFRGRRLLKKQLEAVYERVKDHTGPMVWAGDFNTWVKKRKRDLDAITKKLGLEEVEFSNRSEIALELDHAYVRGFEVLQAEQKQVDLSDHEPLFMRLEYK